MIDYGYTVAYHDLKVQEIIYYHFNKYFAMRIITLPFSARGTVKQCKHHIKGTSFSFFTSTSSPLVEIHQKYTLIKICGLKISTAQASNDYQLLGTARRTDLYSIRF